jgi:hypothetical protein
MSTRPISTSIVATALILMLPAQAANAQDASPLPGPATTSARQAPSSGWAKTVTDVRVGTHDGFDRVTFEYVGDGEFGWLTAYEEDPRSDGAGLPVEFDGIVTLTVVLRPAEFPPDAPETFSDDVAGPAGGIINEVVNGNWYEGDHTFYIGLDAPVPYRIARLSDPSRVVIDLVHDAATPIGPVDAGVGGATDHRGAALLPLVLLGGLLVLAGFGVAHARRRSPHGPGAAQDGPRDA